jgi:hypothetical protein
VLSILLLLSNDAVMTSDPSTSAEVVFLEAASEPPYASSGTALPAGSAGAPAVGPAGAPSAHLALAAAQGLPPATLLALAGSAAELQAPLTAALAVERLWQGTTVLAKEEWQALATQVSQAASQETSPCGLYHQAAIPPAPMHALAPLSATCSCWCPCRCCK